MKVTYVVMQRASCEPQTTMDWIGYILGIGITSILTLILLFFIVMLIYEIVKNFDFWKRFVK